MADREAEQWGQSTTDGGDVGDSSGASAEGTPTLGERYSLRPRREREILNPSAPKVPATTTGSARSSKGQRDPDGASTSSAAPGSTPKTARYQTGLIRCLHCQSSVRNKLKFRTCSECLENYCFGCVTEVEEPAEASRAPKKSFASGMLGWKCIGPTCGHINEDFVSAERLMAHRQQEGTVNVQARARKWTRSMRDSDGSWWVMEGTSRPCPKSSKCSGSVATASKATKWLKSGINNASLIPKSSTKPKPSDNRHSKSAGAARINRIAFLDGDARDELDKNEEESEEEVDGRRQEEKKAAPQGDVMNWTRDDVRAFWISHGLEEQAEKFYKEEFDGQALLLLTHHDIISGLGFSYASAIKVREHVLKLQNNSIVGVSGSASRKGTTFKPCNHCGHCQPN